MRGSIRAIVERHNGERRQLLAILRDVQQTWRSVPDEAITIIAEEMDLPRVHVEGTATFYHFLSREHRGDTTIYLNTSATSADGRLCGRGGGLRRGGGHAVRQHHGRPAHRPVHDLLHRHVRSGAGRPDQRRGLHAADPGARARPGGRHQGWTSRAGAGRGRSATAATRHPRSRPRSRTISSGPAPSSSRRSCPVRRSPTRSMPRRWTSSRASSDRGCGAVAARASPPARSGRPAAPPRPSRAT